MKLTKIQQMKVDEIVSHYNSNVKEKVEFKAPTGSGKTLMATNVISELIHHNSNDKLLFIIATLSSADLPKAFEQKIEQYKKGLIYTRFDVEHIESPSTNKSDKTEGTIKLLPEHNKVYIFGVSSFGSRRIFTERNIISDFLQMSVEQGYKIVYIRDEAHRGTSGSSGPSKADRERFEKLMEEYSHFILHMTATPNFKANTKKVIMYENELNDINLNGDKWLIKSTPKSLLDKDIVDTDLLEEGLKEFKKIQEDYKKLRNDGIYIRPALLIQVDNETEQNSRTFQEDIKHIQDTLNKYNLSWVKYFGNQDKDSNHSGYQNFNLLDITKNDSDIDVVIFKIGPATGWDIPRACMLLQLRNVSSTTLNTQTIGRIKRNPYPELKRNSITDNYYIYSNAPVERSLNVYKYKVKDRFVNDEFAIIKISNKDTLKDIYLKYDISYELMEYLNNSKNKILNELRNHFMLHKGKKVYREVRETVGGNHIFTDISNVFIFLRDLHSLKERNKIIYDNNEKVFLEFYKNIKNERLYGRNEEGNVKFEHLIFSILKYHKESIINLYTKKAKFKPQYKVELEPYDPKNYVQITSDEENKATINSDIYLFDVKRNEENHNYQPLDSKPETQSFQDVKDAALKLNEKVSIWAKSMTSSNVSADYLDENNTVRRSYFDFVIKFKNGAFLYIESKSKNDIDKAKTETLLKSYADYFKEKENTLFDYPLFLSLWTVDVENGTSTHETFYDRNLYDVELNGLTVLDLIETIANMDI